MHNDAQSRDSERQRAPHLTNKRKYFAHLAGSKIASHSVATRPTARVRQHVRNSMRTTASEMCPGQATKEMPTRDPRRRFRLEKYTFERLHPAFAATLHAADDRFVKDTPRRANSGTKTAVSHRGRLSWKQLQITRAREQGFLFGQFPNPKPISKREQFPWDVSAFVPEFPPRRARFSRFLGFRTTSNLESSAFHEFASQSKQQNHQR